MTTLSQDGFPPTPQGYSYSLSVKALAKSYAGMTMVRFKLLITKLKIAVIEQLLTCKHHIPDPMPKLYPSIFKLG